MDGWSPQPVATLLENTRPILPNNIPSFMPRSKLTFKEMADGRQ
jgi:hypothetical protein